ncbi:DNA polymerase zeta catalytic subunit-like [Dendroctonus ponderosae]|uniref:DNA polymerase zeta catalytic subunit n=1 Tax=Dendroctonus ponderosae TaxID=77166 RepID=UPI002034F950|nr:DNA polymerase zeta catalytic subunit [Dendroctonus ponderosae]XP_048520387.1 DNA polymerase zeta catalytic subunit-like [Dendroctonus ponderosae]
MQNSVKIIVIDYYMETPKLGLDATYSEFRCSSVSQVPVLRCFGSTNDGKKICLHIHGVFPYLYIPYDGHGKPEDIMRQIARGLDKAINISFNQANSNAQHVYKISLVSGIPMYGYHVKKHQFFKIYLYNPKLIGKVGTLLLNKAILGQIFQPHEVHLNFTLQFMIDYNLHGMSNLLLSNMRYRLDPDKPYHDIDIEWFLPPSIEKISSCELEADILAENILNRQEILSGNLAINPGIAAIWDDEKQRRRNKNQSSQLGDYLELKNTASAPSKTHLIFQQALKERLAAASTDIEVSKQNSDTSIYPAECPKVADIQNASSVDIHYPSSLELSLDETLNLSSSQDLDKTLTPSDVTLNTDVQDVLHLLEQLADEKVSGAEEDMSILSQVLAEEPVDEAADLLDLSMPFDALTTPIKKIALADTHSNANDIKYFNTTPIPQIDGQVEDLNAADTFEGSNVQNLHTEDYCSTHSPTWEKDTGIIRSGLYRLEEQTFRSDMRSKNTQVKVMRRNFNVGNSTTLNILKTSSKTKVKIVPSRQWLIVNGLLKSEVRWPIASNIYINCDGAMDSSSEDEEKITLAKVAKGKSEPTYAPLGIQLVRSPSVYSSNEKDLPHASGDFSRDCNINEDQMPSTSSHFQQAELHHKRRLFLSSDNSSNRADTEAFLSSRLSALKSNRKSKTSQITYPDYAANSSDSDIFSDNCDLEPSMPRRQCELKNENADPLDCDKSKQACPYSSSNPTFSLANSDLEIKYLDKLHQVHMSEQNSISGSYKPLMKAPTKSEVESSLDVYKFPHEQTKEPFYSNVDDYTGPVEIGHKVLRISSSTTAHLADFTSNNALDNHRKMFMENVANLTHNSSNICILKLAHCRSKTLTLRPVKKPPTVSVVEEWIKSNSTSHHQEPTCSLEETNEMRSKLYVSDSPGDESIFDASLSLTPDSLPQTDHCSQAIVGSIVNNDRKIGQLNDLQIPEDKSNTSCQISGQTLQNSFGFDKSVQDLQAARATVEPQFLTTMVMELHIRTRGDLRPDPQLDTVCAIFYSIFNDVPNADRSKASGVIAVNCLPVEFGAARPDFLYGIGTDCDIAYVESEEALIYKFVNLVKKWDPDVLAGYEIEMLSWGYIVERAAVLSINLLPLLGRSQLHKFGKSKLKHDNGELETNIIGRIVLNVWRIMRHEIALQSYTFESVVYHLLHRRVPMYTSKDLTRWWDHRSNLYRHRVVRYYLQRTDTILELFDKQDFLNRTSELAKLFGILFYEVLSRGSQFRVESMMLRLAKPLNYIPVSPDTQQRAGMKAPEYVPLIMEPKSELYTDPVIVLDFQSLYPSIIIAYNYCFTTCLGRVNKLGSNYPFEFGATQLKVSKNIVRKLCKRDLLNYSPCGVVFVKQKVREGILPRMLKEVLDTRLMVKNSMKENKGNDPLQKVLHNRQLGLKLIANVTYGYTAANFSGRMCCVEVGDSVVSKGRETLQRAIALVESTPEWGAKVVYGDTDSMFVLVPGRSKKDAFTIGKKIADAVTADNPDPVKLKLEKVYQPCILQTKKRYVGYMYETVEVVKPIYEAKGIETVRRDGCPAVSKMLQKCLTLLFETKDVSLIKNYVLKQFNKIQIGRASIQDLTFAKEYRGRSGYKPAACVPALELARKWTSVDKRNEPRNGERVPYVIVNGPPGLPLIRLVRSPRDLLNDNSLRPNALYYITKVIIPPLNRCLNLIGADVNTWFHKMPRKNKPNLPNSSPIVKSTLSQYFISNVCVGCSQQSQGGLCQMCQSQPNITYTILAEKLRKWEENYNNALLICQSCTSSVDQIVCVSLDCPVLYRRNQTFNDQQQSGYVRQLMSNSNIF